MTLHLPDVSEYQRNVEWPKVVAHNGGAAVIRAYNGHRADYLWPGRRDAARKAGVRVLGIYAYMVASRPALDQAREFVHLVGALRPGEFAVLDLEEGTGDQRSRAETFLAYCDAHLTYPGYNGAWLYSGASFFHDHGLMPIANSRRHTWVAAYGQSQPPNVPHTLWQHTSAESWPGIGRCDCSVYEGTLAGLRVAVATTPPKPVVVVTPTPPRQAPPTPPKQTPPPAPPPVATMPDQMPASWVAQLVAALVAALRKLFGGTTP